MEKVEINIKLVHHTPMNTPNWPQMIVDILKIQTENWTLDRIGAEIGGKSRMYVSRMKTGVITDPAYSAGDALIALHKRLCKG